MEVKLTRITDDAMKFDVTVSSKNNHAHGALTRSDKQRVTAILAETADRLEKYLREVEEGDPRRG